MMNFPCGCSSFFIYSSSLIIHKTMIGKKIILSISGSIAAYKAAFLTRLLIKSGAEVQILMTEAATQFITPLTLSTLSKRPVHTQVSSEESWNNHVELGLWADAMIIAPTTATTLAKLANGIADNVIVATYLSARCPVFFAPAMDLDMWLHLEKYFSSKEDLVGKKALITAGPTYEPIDPVRFIGNRSSGKMGVALAKELAERGTEVKLILGPSSLKK